MSRPFKPDNAPQLMPYLVVRNPESALRFYEDAFGFQQEDEPLIQQGEIIHCEMSFMDCRIMLGLEGVWNSTAQSPASSHTDQGIGLYIYCPNVNDHHEQATQAGAEIIQSPQDMFWGDRTYSVKDPDGYRWSFATNIGEFDPAKLPQN